MLIIPGTPLLLTGVDRRESPDMSGFRDALHSALGRARTWTMVLPGPQIPSLLSLGGLGIGRGARVRCADGECVVDASDALSGDDLGEAVRRLRAERPDEAVAAQALPTGVLVGVLAALEALRRVRLVPGPAPRASLPLGEAAPLLVPLDFSGAAHPDAPLEPRAGAVEFDEHLEAALTGSIDTALLSRLHAESDAAAASTEALAAVDLAGARARTLSSVDVHCVRYRLIGVESTASRPRPADGGHVAASAERRA